MRAEVRAEVVVRLQVERGEDDVIARAVHRVERDEGEGQHQPDDVGGLRPDQQREADACSQLSSRASRALSWPTATRGRCRLRCRQAT